MEQVDRERLDLCISEGNGLKALTGKEFVQAYDFWHQKALDAVALAFGRGSEEYKRIDIQRIYLGSEEQQRKEMVEEQLRLLRELAK